MRKVNKRSFGIGNLHRDPTEYITKTSGVAGILASLWRRIQFDIGISGTRFEILLTDFINKAKRNSAGEHPVSRHFTRGNLRRELEKDKMTIKVFIKAMRLIRVKKISFIVELTHSDNKVTLHRTDVDLGSPEMKAEFAREARGEHDNEE